MPRALSILIATIALAAAIGCGSTSSTTVAGPSPAKCQLTATNSTPNFTATGGQGAIVVQAERECAWTAAAQVTWVALMPPTDGQGGSTLRYNVQPNPSGLPRRGSVNVAGQVVEVGQAGVPCRFELDRPRAQVAADVSMVDVNVQGPTGCPWTAVSEANWITVAQGAEGNGPGRVTLRALANPGAARVGTVLIAGVRFEITQVSASGQPPAPGPPTPPPTPGCTFTVNPNGPIVADDDGETGTIAVDTTVDCPWTASTTAAWIQLTSSGGTGPGQVGYTIAPTTSDRTDVITVAGTTITVTQTAAAPQPITLNGDVANLAGTCPAMTFVLAAQPVRTSSSTTFKGGNCAKLKDGEPVIVRGLLSAQGTVDATELEFVK